MTTWFRMYNEVLDDPKVQKLPAEAFRAWVNILCLACRHDGELPPITDIAFALRLTESKAADTLQILTDAGLLQVTGDGRYMPHNWNARQYKSDVSNERVARYRKRKSNGECNVTHNDDVTANETAPETETESDTKQKEPPVVPLEGDATPKEPTDGKPRRGKHPMPADWIPGDKHFAAGEREGYGRSEVEWLAEQFRDWAASGAKRYADWDAAFRNWIKSDIARRQIEGRRKARGNGVSGNPSAHRGLATAILEAGAAIQRGDRGTPSDILPSEGYVGGYGEGQSGFGEPLPPVGDGRTIDGICEASDPDDAETGGGIDVGGGVPGTPSNGTGGRGSVRAEEMAGDAEREVVSDVARTEGHDRHSGGTTAEDVGSPDDLTKRPDCLRRTG